MIGKVISHYRILEELGRGGMGVVYKAEDLTLTRPVALKFLPHGLEAHEPERARFLQEARATAVLNHPNLCTIHEIAEFDGQQFIVMEFVDGKTLREKIAGGMLQTGSAVDYAIQIGEALEEAHNKGIVHRDVKTDNIMVNTKNQVKVMDFGLATLKGSLRLTRTGSTIGTLAYMAPEQIEEKGFDARSDIFSFGVVLYEMLTGHLPFRGEHDAARVYSIVNEEPTPIRNYLPEVSSELEHIISRALEKDPESRYQSVHEMVSDLRSLREETSRVVRQPTPAKSKLAFTQPPRKWLKHAAFGAGILMALVLVIALVWFLILQMGQPSEPIPIAVISFENQTGDPAFDYLRDAIPNLLITSLEQSRFLQVTTSERMHDLLKQMGKEDVKIINRDLGFELCRRDSVRALVVGSYVKAGDMFATDLKVIDVASKKLLKSAGSKGEGVGSILRTQIDDLSKQIASGIGVPARQVLVEQKAAIDVTTSSMDAYRYYLRGREEFDRQYYSDALRFYGKAVELDTSFAVAYLSLAQSHAALGEVPLARAAYQKANILSDRASRKEKLKIQAAFAREIEGDVAKWLRILEQLEEEYPKEKEPHLSVGSYYLDGGQFDKAISEFNEVVKLDPEYGLAWNSLGYIYVELGKYEQAIECFSRYATLSPGNADPLDSMADGYFLLGKFDEAIKRFGEAYALKPEYYPTHWKIAYLYALQEKYDQAFRILDQAAATSTSEFVRVRIYWWKAFYFSWLGNVKQALENLRYCAQSAARTKSAGRIASCYSLSGWIDCDGGMLPSAKESFTKAHDRMAETYPRRTVTLDAFWLNQLGFVHLKEGRLDSLQSKLAIVNSLLHQLPSKDGRVAQFFQNVLYSEWLLARDSCLKVIALWQKSSPWEAEAFGGLYFGSFNVPFLKDVLARAYVCGGEIEKAIDEYERLTTTDPTKKKERRLIHPKYHYRLALLYEQKGIVERAVAEYTKFLDLWKNADKDLPEPKDARSRLAKLRMR